MRAPDRRYPKALVEAPMIDPLAPSRTIYVPMIEVMMQTPPISSGKDHQRDQQRRSAERERDRHHGDADGYDIGLEQVGGHAGAVADIVADVVGDHGGVARIVLGNSGLDLADEVGADVGGLGEDPPPSRAKIDTRMRRGRAR